MAIFYLFIIGRGVPGWVNVEAFIFGSGAKFVGEFFEINFRIRSRYEEPDG